MFFLKMINRQRHLVELVFIVDVENIVWIHDAKIVNSKKIAEVSDYKVLRYYTTPCNQKRRI